MCLVCTLQVLPSIGSGHSLYLLTYLFCALLIASGHLPGIIRWIVEKVVAKPIFYVWNEKPGHVVARVKLVPRKQPDSTSGSDAVGGGESPAHHEAVEEFSFTGPCMHESHFIVKE